MKEPNIPSSEADRLKALEDLKILDTPAEEAFDDIVLLASQICNTPIALVSLVDKDRQWFKSKIGLSATETKRSISFCGHAINTPQNLFMVTNAAEDERFYDNPLVTDSPNIRFYAGMPLHDVKGHALGTLCVIDEKPRKLTKIQQDCLEALARRVDSELELRSKYSKIDSRYKRIASILQNTRDIIYEVDIMGRFSFANDSMMKITEYPLEEIIGLKFTEIIYPDDRKRVKQHYLSAIEKKVSNSEIEFRIQTKSGQVRWVSQRVSIQYKTDGSLLNSIGVVTDITQLVKERNAHERTRILLQRTSEVARIGTWEANLDQESLKWSEMTRTIHEVSDNYEPTLESGINFYKEGYSRDKIQEVFNKAISDGAYYDEELEIVTAKENVRWVRAIGIPYMKNGKCTRVNGTFQDIDERKRSEKAIHELLEKTSEQNKRLHDFAHITSHNLRSHSGNISTLLDFFINDHPEIVNTELFKMIKSASDSLTTTVSNLTDITLMNSSSELLLVPLDLHASITRAQDNLAGLLNEANIEFINNVSKSQMVLGIPAYVDSILNNLISNSIKYRNPAVESKIIVDAKIRGAQIEVIFSDNGIGMDMSKTKDRVFGFNQTFHRNKDSKGIGLYITKSHIDSMGGEITVDSEVNKGTTFTFTLNRLIIRS
ncbi:MAG: hypothetical protein Salg2KO_19730 [Salibacteraceae bacterium]